jgi:hypothetical protein
MRNRRASYKGDLEAHTSQVAEHESSPILIINMATFANSLECDAASLWRSARVRAGGQEDISHTVHFSRLEFWALSRACG